MRRDHISALCRMVNCLFVNQKFVAKHGNVSLRTLKWEQISVVVVGGRSSV